MARIVVGVDGSAGSLTALRWALDEAKLRGAQLDVVHAWTYPYFVTPPNVPMPMPPREDLEAGAQAVLEEAVHAVVPQDPGVAVHSACAEGPAAATLVERATGADLVVVGSRGHGGFVGLLLGSVSQQVAHHAPCPVVIVPARHAG